MFWDKKKKKGLPDLPSTSIPVPKPGGKKGKSSLPTFPDKPSEKGFSQNIIKEAVKPKETFHFQSVKLKNEQGGAPEVANISKKDDKHITQEVGNSEVLPKIPGISLNCRRTSWTIEFAAGPTAFIVKPQNKKAKRTPENMPQSTRGFSKVTS